LASDEVVTVTVIGQGISKDAAKRDALRNALEQGGAAEINSHSHAENFVLLRDTIYMRAEGIVTDHRILEEGEAAGGEFYCKITAKVKQSSIASTWGEVQQVLGQIGHPGVLVYIKETIDGVPEETSIFESKIEDRLVESGFKVYAREQLLEIESKESLDASLEGDIKKLQALAKKFRTQIMITGTARANADGVYELAGRPTAMYNCDAAIKMYYTDTAQLIAPKSLPTVRGGAPGFREHSPQAGKKALDNAGLALGEELYASVMRNWATRISAGGEIALELNAIEAGDVIKIKVKLRDIDKDKIMSVDGPDLTEEFAVYRIKAKMTATELSEYLVQGEWESLIKITDIKDNRIQAKWIGR
jgi:hypothetical protein